jgi:hypothetical protein
MHMKKHVTITDSLNRREVLHTEGDGGLKRVVKEEKADGSATHSEYDPAGGCWRRQMRRAVKRNIA